MSRGFGSEKMICFAKKRLLALLSTTLVFLLARTASAQFPQPFAGDLVGEGEASSGSSALNGIEPQAVGERQEGRSAESVAAASSNAPAGSASAEAMSISSDAAAIGPLDDWSNVKPMVLGSSMSQEDLTSSQSSSASVSKESTYLDPEYYGFEEVGVAPPVRSGTSHLLTEGEEPEKKEEVFEIAYRFSKSDKLMFERIEKVKKKRARIYQREIAKRNFIDTRGEIEIVMCSLNLQGFSTPQELQIVLKRKIPKSAVRKLAQTLKEQNCDVVAAQGIVARSRPTAEAAMLLLKEELEKQTEREWQAVTNDIDRGNVFTGFFLQRGRLQLTSVAIQKDTLLPRYAPFTLKKFPSAPQTIMILVPGREGKRSRELSFTTFFIGEDVKISTVPRGSKKDKKKERQVSLDAVRNLMQIAEGLRQTIEMKREVSEPPVIVVAGERSDLAAGVVSRIFEGRQQLKQFKHEGNCSVNEELQLECKEPVHLPQLLFNVSCRAPEAMAKKRALAKAMACPSSGMFMMQEDLPYAYKHQYSGDEYTGYYLKQKFGQETLAIHVLSLNW